MIGASNQELFSQNANGLVMDSKFWNGDDVSTTLTESFADDRMPDKGKLPCVITESGKGFYSESAVGQTLEAHEDQHRRNIICAGFCQGASPAAGSIGYHEQVSPTIKAGESGTAQVPALLCVHGSQDPIVNYDHANAIGRNQGAENCVCQYGDVAGSLTARHDSSPCADRGMNVLCYENHMQDSRVKPCGECSPQINAKAGTGGGNLPLVQHILYDNQTRAREPKSCGDVSCCLQAAIGMAGNNLPLVQEVFSVDALSSNSMKSDNPNSGFHRAEVAKTLDTTIPTPQKNQGGQCVVEQVGYYPSQYQNPQPTESPCITAGNCNTIRGDTPLVQAVAIAENIIGRKVENGGNGIGAQEELAYTQNTVGVMGIASNMTVRRLLPVECERLMGFPDNWTKIPWRGKPADECPDSPRYKACGNSMGVNCMRWIGLGIEAVEAKYNK